MKKEKSQSPLKTAKKKTREAIQKRLAKLFTTITTELSQDKPAIDIEKESKKLAKRLTKGLVIKEEAKEAPAPAAPVKEAKAAKVKPAAKPKPAKEEKPAAAKPAAKTSKNGAAKQVKNSAE